MDHHRKIAAVVAAAKKKKKKAKTKPSQVFVSSTAARKDVAGSCTPYQ